MENHDSVFVYIGTETTRGSRGIYQCSLDLHTGALTDLIVAAETGSPGFLCTDPKQQFLYCTGKPSNPDLPYHTVTSFSIDPNRGELSLINAQTTEDMTCCHISTAQAGSTLLAADYGHGKAALFPVESNGRMRPASQVLRFEQANNIIPDRQDLPHVHSINPDASHRNVLVCDFSADAIRCYALEDDSHKLLLRSSTAVAPGSGPRHLVCHPNGQWAYVIHELNGTIAVFDMTDAPDSLTLMQEVSTLPPDFSDDNTTAEIVFSPDLRFLYGSNRGHDSIAHYSIDPETGLLSLQGIVSTEGEHPRNFTIDASGRHMLISNRDSDTVTVFRLDPETGVPAFTGHQISLSMPMRIEIMRPR